MIVLFEINDAAGSVKTEPLKIEKTNPTFYKTPNDFFYIFFSKTRQPVHKNIVIFYF